MSSLLPALFVLAAASASPQVAPDPKARVDAVFQEYDRSDSPGCALGVYRDGKIIYERGYGMSNLELGVANSPQSVFDIGSTGKQFTAFSIHLLARDGKLSLDDDIRKWVPEIPSYGKTVTIRNLLHHTGGLRDYIELMELQGVEDRRPDDRRRLPRHPRAPEGAQLRARGGVPLQQHRVLPAFGRRPARERPVAAGLRRGADLRSARDAAHPVQRLAHRASSRTAPRATGRRRGGGFGIDMGDWEQNGDGGVLTTVEDLQLWDQNFYEPKVGDRRLLDAMLTVGVLNNGTEARLRLGPGPREYKGLPTVSHGGAWVGYRAQILRFPQQKFSVACLCNLAESNPSRLAQQVADVYLGRPHEGEAAKATATKAAATRPRCPRASWSGSPARTAIPSRGQVLDASRSARTGSTGETGRRHADSSCPRGPDRLRDRRASAAARGEVQFDGRPAAGPGLACSCHDRRRTARTRTRLFEPRRSLDALAGGARGRSPAPMRARSSTPPGGSSSRTGSSSSSIAELSDEP